MASSDDVELQPIIGVPLNETSAKSDGSHPTNILQELPLQDDRYDAAADPTDHISSQVIGIEDGIVNIEDGSTDNVDADATALEASPSTAMEAEEEAEDEEEAKPIMGGHISDAVKQDPLFELSEHHHDSSMVLMNQSEESSARGQVQLPETHMVAVHKIEPSLPMSHLLGDSSMYSPSTHHVKTPMSASQSSLISVTSDPSIRLQSPLDLVVTGSGSLMRKRAQLDGLQKKFICEMKRDNPKFTATDISNAFCERYHRELPRSTVSDILKKAHFWLGLDMSGHEARIIRHRAVKFPAIEDSLFDWYQQVKIQGGSLSDQMLVERAKAIRDELQISESEFKVSNGWLQNFKRRHSIRPFTAGVETESKDLPVLIKESNCKADDVYSFEERGLNYRAPPLKSLIMEYDKDKNKQRDQLTVGLCVNAASTNNLPPLVIGKETQLRCFGKSWTPATSGVHYYSNHNATMNTEIFADWVGKVNMQMLEERRHILLFVNDSVVHRLPGLALQDIRGYQGYKLSHMTILFLFPGAMPVFQPLDVGIFQSFRCLYKKFLLSWILEELSTHPEGVVKVDSVLVSLKQGITFIQDAWLSLEPLLIRACWAKSGLLPKEWSVDIVDPDEVERSRSISQANELASLCVRLNLDGLTALPVSEYLNMPGEVIADDEITMEDFGVLVKPDHDGIQDEEDAGMEEEDERQQQQQLQQQQHQDEEHLERQRRRVLSEDLTVDNNDDNIVLVDVNDVEPKQVALDKARECAETLECFFANEGTPEEQAMIHQLRNKIRGLIVNKLTKQKAMEHYFNRNQFASP